MFYPCRNQLKQIFSVSAITSTLVQVSQITSKQTSIVVGCYFDQFPVFSIQFMSSLRYQSEPRDCCFYENMTITINV